MSFKIFIVELKEFAEQFVSKNNITKINVKII